MTMQDSLYSLRLAVEMNVLPLALQITNIAGNVLSRTLLGGRSERNEFLLLHAFTEKDYICPDRVTAKTAAKVNINDNEWEKGNGDHGSKRGKKKPSYVGGLVLEPKKGFYDKFILLMDFNSLYPSIIQEYNICFTTVESNLAMDYENPDGIPFLPEPETEAGILPTEIRKLVESRREVKKLMKSPGLSQELKQQYDIRQKALKLTANSMYGCLGFTYSRFYAKHLAALVTSKGREILLHTRDLVDKMNFEVIYGDTDSIMINTNCTDYEMVFKLGHKIKSEVNKLYKQLELEVDGVFKYMLLLKKKKYAALMMTKLADGRVVEERELKGLDIVRRDWSQLASDAGKHIIDQILSDQEADERLEKIHLHLEEVKDNLYNGKYGLEVLAIMKQLTKSPEDYPDRQTLPHVQVALRMNGKQGRKQLKMGDTVAYVICQDTNAKSASQKAYHIDEVRENPSLTIDHEYYLSQQVHPVVARLCDPIEGTDAARIAQCLGLDPSHFQSSKLTQDEEVEKENVVSDEEKFWLCERFSFNCPQPDCNTLITVDAPTRVMGSKDNFFLDSCPNPKCSMPNLYEGVTHILNKLRIDIRKHIAKYYEGWLICEDPGCPHRTRRIPLKFEKGFPICDLCGKGVLCKEYSESKLYKQLCFYEYIFDFQKGCSKNKELRHKNDLVHKAYQLLQNEVLKHLKNNQYSDINLGKIFSCLLIKKNIKIL